MKGHEPQSNAARKCVTSGIGCVMASSDSRRRCGVRPEDTREIMAMWGTRFTRAALVAAMSLACLTLMGCGAAVRHPPAGLGSAADSGTVSGAAPTGKDNLSVLYNQAILNSAVVTLGDEFPLVPLTPGPDGTFTVTTWAGCRGEGAQNRCGSYVAPGSITLKWDVWVTGNDEVRNKCRTWTGDIVLQIHQLLGMPPPQEPMSSDTIKRQFVTISAVPAASIFRPCTDPRLDTDRCAGTTLPPSLPPNAPPDYYRWFTSQAMSSWQISASGEAPIGFPWTRLGYTYNWSPGESSRYGASEYVISGGSKPVTVNVVAVQTAKDFCKPQ